MYRGSVVEWNIFRVMCKLELTVSELSALDWNMIISHSSKASKATTRLFFSSLRTCSYDSIHLWLPNNILRAKEIAHRQCCTITSRSIWTQTITIFEQKDTDVFSSAFCISSWIGKLESSRN